MAIAIKRVKNERGVALHTLKVGDTFMYDNRVGVIADRNGLCFPLDLTTCSNFRHRHGDFCTEELAGSEIVLPIEVEMTYKIMG